ncbi:14216_t:CDS:2, partial [Cetraspora pellucida]
YPLDLQFEEINSFSILCDNLMNHAYNAAEFKDQIKFVLLILYERLIGVVNYFLKLIVMDEIIKLIENYCKNDQELEKIKQLCKAENDSSMFDQKYKYHATLKGLKMCKFVKLFCAKEKYKFNFQDFYNNCHYFYSEEKELSLYRENFHLLDINISSRN